MIRNNTQPKMIGINEGRMKKAFLYAYDRQNLGDDLFVHTIAKRYPHVKFYMWSYPENRETFRVLPNVKVIDRNSRLVKLLTRIRPSLEVRYRSWWEKRCQVMVVIGGSIFPEYPTWDCICNLWEYRSENRQLFVLGCNFPTYKSEAYRKRMSEIFNKMQDVCFRDRYSYDLFKVNKTVRYAPDILFSYAMPKVTIQEKQIFVSVMDCADRDPSSALDEYDARYVRNMCAMLKNYLADGYTLVMGSFCKEEGDERGIDKVLQAMGCVGDPRIRILSYNGTNVDEVVAAIAGSECVIATRFHAMVLALAAGRPVLPVIYSDKTIHVLEDIGFSGKFFDLRKDEVWSYPESKYHLEHFAAVDVETLSVASQQHFLKLDQRLI